MVNKQEYLRTVVAHIGVLQNEDNMLLDDLVDDGSITHQAKLAAIDASIAAQIDAEAALYINAMRIAEIEPPKAAEIITITSNLVGAHRDKLNG